MRRKLTEYITQNERIHRLDLADECRLVFSSSQRTEVVVQADTLDFSGNAIEQEAIILVGEQDIITSPSPSEELLLQESSISERRKENIFKNFMSFKI